MRRRENYNLKVVFPELAKEWHPLRDKNLACPIYMTPFKIFFGIDIASTKVESNMKEDKMFRRGQTRTPRPGIPLKRDTEGRM